MSSPEDKAKHSRRRKNHVQRDLYKRFKEKDQPRSGLYDKVGHSIPVDKKEKYPRKVFETIEESYDDDCI